MIPRWIGNSRVVPAPPEEIFALLSDPARHPEIDGSGTVRKVISDQGGLQLGSQFEIAMKRFGFPYKMTNTVVEFEENRRIAWCHYGKNRWRYELEPVEGGTRVTETVDFSDTRFRWLAMIMNPPKYIKANITTTLDNLAKRFTA